MLFKEVAQLVLAAIALWSRSTEAAPKASVKLCGRQLSEIMSRVCHAYNSPSWDVPTVVEQPGVVARRKRQLGIADECCVIGCTWEQLSEYCSITAYSESPLEAMDSHIIADRSVEKTSAEAVPAGAGDGRRHQGVIKSARAAPVVGTVSPLITWGRTLNTDLPTASIDKERYAYVVHT